MRIVYKDYRQKRWALKYYDYLFTTVQFAGAGTGEGRRRERRTTPRVYVGWCRRVRSSRRYTRALFRRDRSRQLTISGRWAYSRDESTESRRIRAIFGTTPPRVTSEARQGLIEILKKIIRYARALVSHRSICDDLQRSSCSRKNGEINGVVGEKLIRPNL